MSNQHHPSKHESHGEHQHHILSTKMALRIFAILLVLTVITVVTAQYDLGILNFAVAIFIASVKASLVCLFFMGLKYDHKENSVIFSTSIIFMFIFMVLTFSDLLTRGDVYVKGSILPESMTANVKSKFKKPWIATPELVAHGKEQFQILCVTCHGPNGEGNGPASAGLNPKPRNFTQATGWKNGRKPSIIFGTLTHGLNAMPSFASLPSDDRWSLAAYVRTLGSAGDLDTDADLVKAGIDPKSDDGGGGGGEKSIPIGLAIDQLSEGK